MKLIFVTRKVDRSDALTGFVFTWISALAKNLERLYVICQEKGDVSGLPGNVEVISFGKERGYGKARQGYHLFKLSWGLARNADGFFVHMHPAYAILASLPARIFGRKIILWYTHKSVDLKLRIAHALVDEVLTASRESFRLPSRKVKVIGHGIDLAKFSGKGERVSNAKFRIVSIGRISPVKDYETLIKAAKILKDEDTAGFEIEIYGRAGLPQHQAYLDSLVQFVHNADLEDIVKFQGELSYDFVEEIYREADLFVNLSKTGSIDKNVLEAAAASVPVLTSNEAFHQDFLKISPLLIVRQDDPAELAAKLGEIMVLPARERSRIGQTLRTWVERNHDLKTLVEKIIREFAI
ncbi:MAG: Glycosyltransferase [Parcubacteria group bacterium GW2011_GWA2_51_12]|nr:MAG: Glycosyltransferase [Parcubacteria group bacterium GW2011_GWA2_51_12]